MRGRCGSARRTDAIRSTTVTENTSISRASLDLSPHSQLVVSASNLTDTVDRAYEVDEAQLLQLGRVGRSVAVSFRWSL